MTQITAKYDTATVVEAYQKFKTVKDSRDVKILDEYLKGFQKSREAWAITQEILMSKLTDTYILLQSASTLKQKLEFDFAQLPQQDYLNQATLLISMIHHFSLVNRNISHISSY